MPYQVSAFSYWQFAILLSSFDAFANSLACLALAKEYWLVVGNWYLAFGILDVLAFGVPLALLIVGACSLWVVVCPPAPSHPPCNYRIRKVNSKYIEN